MNWNPQNFWWWQGASGYWHITTVFPLDRLSMKLPAVYIMVARDRDGRAVPLYVGQTGNLADRLDDHMNSNLLFAQLLGGTELHVHLLAEAKADRLAVETDLRRAHTTLLNRQPNPVGILGVFGGK